MDLAQYLCQHEFQLAEAREASQGLMLKGLRVIELGCGHGIPGLVALSQGAEVHFQVSRDRYVACAHSHCSSRHLRP